MLSIVGWTFGRGRRCEAGRLGRPNTPVAWIVSANRMPKDRFPILSTIDGPARTRSPAGPPPMQRFFRAIVSPSSGRGEGRFPS